MKWKQMNRTCNTSDNCIAWQNAWQTFGKVIGSQICYCRRWVEVKVGVEWWRFLTTQWPRRRVKVWHWSPLPTQCQIMTSPSERKTIERDTKQQLVNQYIFIFPHFYERKIKIFYNRSSKYSRAFLY